MLGRLPLDTLPGSDSDRGTVKLLTLEYPARLLHRNVVCFDRYWKDESNYISLACLRVHVISRIR